MTRNEAKERLKGVEPFFLSQARTVNGHATWICPRCGNGSGNSGTGLELDPHGKGQLLHYKCFKCGLYADIVELFKIHSGVSDNRAAFDELYSQCGFTIDNTPAETRQTAPQSRARGLGSINTAPPIDPPKNGLRIDERAIDEPAADFTEYYRECTARLEATPAALAYLQRRGISLTTAKRYNLGFDNAWRNPAAKNAPAAPVLILPTSRASYAVRDIRENAPEKYSKQNVGGVNIFNADELYYFDPPQSLKAVFIVEGIFDALSVIESGYSAIALCGLHVEKLVNLLKRYPPNTSLSLAICLDNDTAGQTAAKRLEKELESMNIHAINVTTPDTKDMNEAWQSNPEQTKIFLSQAHETALDLPANHLENVTADEYRARELMENDPDFDPFKSPEPSGADNRQPELFESVSDYINSGKFERALQEHAKGKAYKTGFKTLDDNLGGLHKGLYVIAAPPSVGKTTLALQIADNLAIAENDVIFFSLETSPDLLICKSIARIMYQHDPNTTTTADTITAGDKPESLTAALKEYSSTESRLTILEKYGMTSATVEKAVKDYKARTGRTPIIFIDYLQLMNPKNTGEGIRESYKNISKELHDIAHTEQTPIFVISSVGRESYTSGVGLGSPKESGDIEYNCDALFGLEMRCIRDNQDIFSDPKKRYQQTKMINAEKAKECRDVILTNHKAKRGKTGWNVYFNYYPAHDYFEENALMNADSISAPAGAKQQASESEKAKQRKRL